MTGHMSAGPGHRQKVPHEAGLASKRGRSVTIRIEGELAPHFIEVTEPDLEGIEVLEG